MGTKTGIEWCDSTWNPVRGCSRVSQGCVNCYAERVAARFSGPGLPYEGLAELRVIGNRTEPHWTGKVELVEEHLADPLRWRKPRKIFVNSMSDLFHEGLSFLDIGRVFDVMHRAPQHTFQILTKRPELLLQYMSAEYAVEPPPKNVWLGVSVEDQKTADERIPLLLQTPAAIRFLSCEPLLAPIGTKDYLFDTSRHNANEEVGSCRACGAIHTHLSKGIDWVIAGGESGPGARPMEIQWVMNLMQQCATAGVSFFMKQGSKANWPDFKNIESFPPALQIREFPDAQR